MWSTRLGALALASLLFGAVAPWTAGPVHAAPPPRAPAEAAGAPAALAAARSTGRPVEAVDRRTETQQVFAQPNGSWRLVQSMTPVRVRRGTGWAPVDTRLGARPDGSIAPAATVTDLALSGGGDGPLARLTQAGRSLSIARPGSLPGPALAGDTATHPQLLPGVGLRVRAPAEGVSQGLVGKTPPAAPHP